MGRDRVSIKEVGDFFISVDKDHMSYYRGRQAMDRKYRGWHYHVESPKYSQLQIMEIIENFLLTEMKAEKYDCKEEELYIGVVEHTPEKFSCFRKDGKTCVLWISGFNGKLHVEANKKELYTKNLLSKADLINLFKNYKEEI